MDRFLTVTSQNKVYNRLLGLNNVTYIDTVRGLISASNSYSSTLFLESYDTRRFDWESILDFDVARPYITNIVSNKQAWNSLWNLVTPIVLEEIEQSIDPMRQIDKGESQIYFIDLKNRVYYSGINGWKNIITLKEM